MWILINSSKSCRRTRVVRSNWIEPISPCCINLYAFALLIPKIWATSLAYRMLSGLEGVMVAVGECRALGDAWKAISGLVIRIESTISTNRLETASPTCLPTRSARCRMAASSNGSSECLGNASFPWRLEFISVNLQFMSIFHPVGFSRHL